MEGGSASASGLSSRGKFAEVSLSGMEPKNTQSPVMEVLGFVDDFSGLKKVGADFYQLVVSSFNPSEKYARQFGSTFPKYG